MSVYNSKVGKLVRSGSSITSYTNLDQVNHYLLVFVLVDNLMRMITQTGICTWQKTKEKELHLMSRLKVTRKISNFI